MQIMVSIDFNDLNKLVENIGKQCTVTYKAIGFSEEDIVGRLSSPKFNTKTMEIGIVVELEKGTSLLIPQKFINSLVVEG